MHNAKIIIVEGPDECGKTTFAKKICLHVGAAYQHLEGTKPLIAAMADYQRTAWEDALVNYSNGISTIIDRHFPSEMVYGGVFGRAIPSEITDTAQLIVNHPATRVIYCTDDIEKAVERHRKNQDPAHPYSDKEYREIHAGYEKWAKRAIRMGYLSATRFFKHEAPTRVIEQDIELIAHIMHP